MMNKDLIAKALRFHGQPLQKIWAGERGDHDLYQLGLANPDFSVYFERQKDLTFQDRAKRLKLHQFLARKANELFDRDLQSAGVNTASSDSATGSRQDASETIVAMPPYEYFLNTSAHEKSKVFNSTLEAVAPGQIVYGIVTKPYTTGTQVKVLCTREPLVRYLADIHIRALLPNAFMVPGHDKKGVAKAYAPNDFVCCEVLDISVDADRMTLGMKGVLTKDASAPLGLISLEQIPDYYRRIISDSDDNFQDYLFKSKTFNNTNCYEMLYNEVGLDINETYSHMRSLKYRFPPQDYAIELRQTQASKWAFRSVADGIEHFKIGRHVEAFQCLNKALSIDPRNVEGLVARGALYANKGSFKKAVEDFETALKLNSFHANARKYMGETLVALGRSYEEENQMEEAIKAYQNCLNIIPNHEQARISLDALKRRPGQMNQVIDINMLSIPGSSDFKKKKKSKHKSSSSSSSADDSSDSSSDSHSSGETSSDSDNEKQKKKARKQKSLSPLSKRMGDMNSGNVGSNFELSQPFYMMQKDGKPDYNKMDDILTGDDDYETRVQKLLKDASKHRKQREGKSSGSKKKSKKKRKKAKKEAARLEKKATKEANSLANAFQKPPTDEVALNESLEKYERSLMELQKFQQSSVTTTAPPITTIDLDNDEEPPPAPSFKIRTEPAKRITPPPKAPKISIRIQNTGGPSTARPQPPVISNSAGRTSSSHYDSNYNKQVDTSFKPFPIKGPVVLDKFGCFRLAVPNPEDVEALTRHRRSRSRSKPRLYSRTNIHCHSKSRSRSRSRSNHRGRRGRSKSATRRRSKSLTRHRSKSSGRYRSKSPSHRSNSKTRRRSRSRGRRSRSRGRRSRSRGRRSPDRRGRSPRRGGRSPPRKSDASPLTKPPRRRRPSPFDPNRRPSPGSPSDRRRRSRSSDRRSGFDSRGQKVFGNRVWQRPAEGDNGANGSNSLSETPKPPANSAAGSDGPKSKAPSGIDGRWKHDKFVKEDGISLEEIDKIITQAKKERKEEILQRDKKILKKNPATGF